MNTILNKNKLITIFLVLSSYSNVFSSSINIDEEIQKLIAEFPQDLSPYEQWGKGHNEIELAIVKDIMDPFFKKQNHTNESEFFDEKSNYSFWNNAETKKP